MDTHTPALSNDSSQNENTDISLLSSVHIKAYLDYLHTAADASDAECPLSAEVGERIKDELYRIAESYGEIPSIREQLNSINWALKNVMVGTVRSQEQLAYCLQEKIYYVPARLVPLEKDDDLNYVALHEEGIDGEACIRYWGRVASLDQVKRHTIPVPTSRNNGDEYYLLIHISDWQTLERPIPIHDSYKGRPRYTNPFLLQHCNRSYQLFCIRSAEDYKTCASVISAYNHRYDPGNLHIIGGRFILRTEGDDFVIMNASGRMIDRFPTALYENHPASVIFRISDLLKTT